MVTTDPQSMKHDGGSASEEVLIGRPPAQAPPRVTDYEELDKKAVDILVDSLKYIATGSGIIIAMYAPMVRDGVTSARIASHSSAKALLFAPLLMWFAAIVGTVLGIFPREYRAVTDAEKELVVRKLRRMKILWVRLVLGLFLLGFAIFLYITASQIWNFYPFR